MRRRLFPSPYTDTEAHSHYPGNFVRIQSSDCMSQTQVSGNTWTQRRDDDDASEDSFWNAPINLIDNPNCAFSSGK